MLELQFGLTWQGLSHEVGDVFDAPLAVETLVAFFLESTFLGLWIFGWGRLNRWVHTALIWLVALTAYLSVFWILVANSYLQHPVESRVGALLSNPTFVAALPHVVFAAITTGCFLMAGISSWHLLRGNIFFRTTLRLGVVVASIGAFFTVGAGFAQFVSVREVQPTKMGDDAARDAAVADFTARFGPDNYLPPTYSGLALGMMILLGLLLFCVGVFIPLFYRDWIIRRC